MFFSKNAIFFEIRKILFHFYSNITYYAFKFSIIRQSNYTMQIGRSLAKIYLLVCQKSLDTTYPNARIAFLAFGSILKIAVTLWTYNQTYLIR